MRGFLVLLLFCAGLAAAYWWGESSLLKRSPQALSWYAKEVTTAGVYIQYARTSEIIAPGMELPNGEKLLSFDPVKQTYSTTQQEVILRKK